MIDRMQRIKDALSDGWDVIPDWSPMTTASMQKPKPQGRSIRQPTQLGQSAPMQKPKPQGRPREHIGGRTFVQVVLDDETLAIWNDIPDDKSAMVRSLIRADAETMTQGEPRMQGRHKRQVVLDGKTLEVWLQYTGDRSAWVRQLLWNTFGESEE